ncbi:MAG: hypothetical protein OEU36_25395 [Gammaproteobacteria bacterium]|nr:hypothetical protein [Gammaproteobacteria bacterium]
MTEIDLLASEQSHELRQVEQLFSANAGRSPLGIHVWACGGSKSVKNCSEPSNRLNA